MKTSQFGRVRVTYSLDKTRPLLVRDKLPPVHLEAEKGDDANSDGSENNDGNEESCQKATARRGR